MVRQSPEAESGELPTQGEDEIHIQQHHCVAEDVEGNSSDRCLSCKEKQAAIDCLQKQVASLENDKITMGFTMNKLCEEVKSLKLKASKQAFSSSSIKRDSRMKFYTGIPSVMVFNTLFLLLKPCIPNLVYWRGSKRIIASKNKGRKTQKLCGKDQLLTVLMRLRLGLLTEDLAERFHVSPATCSNIFATWIRFLGNVLGNALVFWQPREAVMSNMPECFLESHKKTRCIIDSTEVYTERPKLVYLQAVTWSDYKKHNTFKFLVAISPTGYIMFLSDSYGGKASDQCICQYSNF